MFIKLEETGQKDWLTVVDWCLMAHLKPGLRGHGQHRPLPHCQPGLGGDAADLVLGPALVDALLAGVEVLQDEVPAWQHPAGKQSSQRGREGGRTLSNINKQIKKTKQWEQTRLDWGWPELLTADWQGCSAPGYPGLRVPPGPALEDEVPAHQSHGLRLGFRDEVGRLVDTQSHAGRLPGPGHVLCLALILPLVRLAHGANHQAAPLQPAARPQRVGSPVLQPADVGGREPLGSLAGDHHGGAHWHVDIWGQALELLVDIWSFSLWETDCLSEDWRDHFRIWSLTWEIMFFKINIKRGKTEGRLTNIIRLKDNDSERKSLMISAINKYPRGRGNVQGNCYFA